MSLETNKNAVRTFFASIDRAQNMAPLADLAGPSYVSHFPGAPPMDLEGTKGYGNVFYAACPGLHHSIENVIAEGNEVAARLTIRGKHTQPFPTPAGPIPPQGRTFELAIMNWFRFDNGKVAEQRVAFDMMNFLQQIGAMPGA